MKPLKERIEEAVENYYLGRVLLWIGKEEPRPIDNPEYEEKLKRLKDQALQAILTEIKEGLPAKRDIPPLGKIGNLNMYKEDIGYNTYHDEVERLLE